MGEVTRDVIGVLLVGTGALATLFAARLAAAGFKVTMLGTWPAGVAALRQHGAWLTGAAGEAEQGYPVQVVTDPARIGPVDYAIVLVKAWQTARAAAQLASCLSPKGVALTLQNGLGNVETLAAALGPERVAVGVTTTGATLVAPGLVRPGGEGVIQVGEHPRLAPLVAALQQAGLAVEVHPDVQGLLWGKLAVNAAINPLSALLEVPNGALVANAAARLFMRRAAQEVQAVAQVLGIRLPFSDAARAAEEVARRTARNFSSMLQDLRRGAPTEIDAICGAVVRHGREVGVSTPVNQALWEMVREKVAARQTTAASTSPSGTPTPP